MEKSQAVNVSFFVNTSRFCPKMWSYYSAINFQFADLLKIRRSTHICSKLWSTSIKRPKPKHSLHADLIYGEKVGFDLSVLVSK